MARKSQKTSLKLITKVVIYFEVTEIYHNILEGAAFDLPWEGAHQSDVAHMEEWQRRKSFVERPKKHVKASTELLATVIGLRLSRDRIWFVTQYCLEAYCSGDGNLECTKSNNIAWQFQRELEESLEVGGQDSVDGVVAMSEI